MRATSLPATCVLANEIASWISSVIMLGSMVSPLFFERFDRVDQIREIPVELLEVRIGRNAGGDRAAICQPRCARDVIGLDQYVERVLRFRGERPWLVLRARLVDSGFGHQQRVVGR